MRKLLFLNKNIVLKQGKYMKKNKFNKYILVGLTLLNVHAFAGGESGGGGDASEARVNEIRSDILGWINKGGASGLKLSIPQTYYEDEMKKVLQNKAVEISFTESKVEVSGKEKTCRGFFEQNKPQITCNISRFQNTKEADQYRLIHHEYAGLAMVEKNEGAASDYEISNQITDFLREEKTLKLSVKSEFRNYQINPCGLSGTLVERIKDCNSRRNSQLKEFFEFSLHLKQRQLVWSKVTETNEGVTIFLNNLTQKLWAMNVKHVEHKKASERHRFGEALFACKDFQKNYGKNIPGKNWQLPKISQFKNDHGILDTLLYQGKSQWDLRSFYIWTSSEANEYGLMWVVGREDQSFIGEQTLYQNEYKGQVLCIGDKDSLFE